MFKFPSRAGIAASAFPILAAPAWADGSPAVAGISADFILFAATLPGAAVGPAIPISVPVRLPGWKVLPETFKGTIFLLSLVTRAPMAAGAAPHRAP